MNFGTKLRTVLAVATSLNTALMATDLTGFNNPSLDLAYTVVSIILNFVIVACVTWFNNDYTEIACEATGEMRAKKAELLNEINGEEFYFEDDEAEDTDEQ